MKRLSMSMFHKPEKWNANGTAMEQRLALERQGVRDSCSIVPFGGYPKKNKIIFFLSGLHGIPIIFSLEIVTLPKNHGTWNKIRVGGI